MKLTILVTLSLITATFIYAGGQSKPSVTKSKPSIDRLAVCPVAPEKVEPSFIASEVPPYDHCGTCNIGVYLPHDDGSVKCTYCNVAKYVVNSND